MLSPGITSQGGLKLRSIILIVLAAMMIGGVVVACSSGDASSPEATDGPAVVGDGTTEPVPTVNISQPSGLRGFVFPVEGACLPAGDDLMPGADRSYRDGVHEGIDFYDSDNCVVMGPGTEIVAAKAGTVVRVDLNYEPLSPEEVEELLALVENGQGADPVVKDKFRGLQIWVDHDSRIVTRYAHLSSVAEVIHVGGVVEQGQVLGIMGESGIPEAVDEPGSQVHLHFEIRVWGGYIGQGRSTDEVRDLYRAAFSP